jgi:undecaprenyl pyrophosphate synthase
MWDIANSYLYFSKKYFPDFDEVELSTAIDEYANSGKRLGK